MGISKSSDSYSNQELLNLSDHLFKFFFGEGFNS